MRIDWTKIDPEFSYLTATEISRKYNLKISTVVRHRDRNNLSKYYKLCKKEGPKSKYNKINWGKYDYLFSEYSDAEISSMLDIPKITVWKHRKKVLKKNHPNYNKHIRWDDYKELLESGNYTQSEMAQKIGCSQQMVSVYLRKK